jgi:Iron only hydrogenase large subunit, C-terminal domain
MDDVRFPNSMKEHDIDYSSLAIIRNPNKCILCGDCVRMCEEVQGVGALTFAYRGSKMKITPAFNRNISEVNCVDCGQCRAICPTGAISIKNQNKYFWELVNDKTKRVVVQIAPAVRVALGENFGLAPGTVTIGKIITALKYMGVDSVFDTSFGADLTVMAEAEEFVERLKNNENLPLFTSCCPAWVKYAGNNFPDLEYNISSCKSPQQMFGSVLKNIIKV